MTSAGERSTKRSEASTSRTSRVRPHPEPGRASGGAAGARERVFDGGRTLLWPPPALGTPARRRRAMRARAPPSAILPVVEAGGLVATLLATQGRRVRIHHRHRISLCSHRHTPPPPSTNSKGSRCLNDVGREGTDPARGWAKASVDCVLHVRVAVGEDGERGDGALSATPCLLFGIAA